MSNETDLGLGRTSFSCEDPSVVTFTPKNYATKSNFRKRCRLCCDNEIGPGQKMRKKHEQITKSGSSMLFFHMFAALLTNLRFLLRTMPSSGGYSNLGARGKNFQKFMLSEKKRGLIWAWIFFSQNQSVL